MVKLLDPNCKIDNIDIPENQTRISHVLCQKAYSILKQENLDYLTTELLKLSLSNILNLANPRLQDLYQSFIPKDEMNNINRIRTQKKDELEFDHSISKIIDEVLDIVKPYAITGNTDNLYTILDELKYKETNKQSTRYQLLNVVEIM